MRSTGAPTVLTAVLLLVAPGVGAAQVGADADAAVDRQQIEAILHALPDAWNARDAEAWVRSFAEDSGFTNILGMHFVDRDANRTRHAELFATIFSRSTLRAEVIDVRLLGDDAAVAELAFELVGYERLPPGVSETEPGELWTRLITVLEERDGEWVVVAAQNTAILPAAVTAGAVSGSRPPPGEE